MRRLSGIAGALAAVSLAAVALAAVSLAADLSSIPIVEGLRPGDFELEPEGANPWIDSAREGSSAWPAGSSGAEYALARWHLDRRRRPPAEAVRIAGFLGAFADVAPAPAGTGALLDAELFRSPARAGTHVLRIGLRAATLDRAAADVVAVVEISDPRARGALALAQGALRQLTAALGERDRLGLVAYGPRGRMILDPVRLAHRSELEDAIRTLRPAPRADPPVGLGLAYPLLERLPDRGRSQRIFLFSDGSADRTPGEAVFAEVRRQARQGRILSTFLLPRPLGDRARLERLARHGDGHYAVIDTPTEARRLMVERLDASLQMSARDLLCRVDFSPDAVFRYRLVSDRSRSQTASGSDHPRHLAPDLGSGQSTVALYEVRLRVRRPARLGTIRIRYREPAGEARRLERPLVAASSSRPSSPALLAWIAASFAEKLAGSYWARDLDYALLLRTFRRLDPELRTSPRVAELRYLIRQAQGLDRPSPPSAAPFDQLRIVR